MPGIKNNDLNDGGQESTKLLRVLVALALRRSEVNPVPLKKQIAMLDEFGLRPIEIALTLGRSAKYVSKELVGIRKNDRRKEK